MSKQCSVRSKDGELFNWQAAEPSMHPAAFLLVSADSSRAGLVKPTWEGIEWQAGDKSGVSADPLSAVRQVERRLRGRLVKWKGAIWWNRPQASRRRK